MGMIRSSEYNSTYMSLMWKDIYRVGLYTEHFKTCFRADLLSIYVLVLFMSLLLWCKFELKFAISHRAAKGSSSNASTVDVCRMG